MQAISVLRKTVRAGETWDVSVRGAVWGLDDLEELYCTVNVGELVLEPGARVAVRGNVCSLVCQRLVGPDEGEAQIAVLPTPFSVDPRHGPFDAAAGAEGDGGWRGHDGAPGGRGEQRARLLPPPRPARRGARRHRRGGRRPPGSTAGTRATAAWPRSPRSPCAPWRAG